MEKEKIILSGKIALQAKEYSKSIIKKGMPLLEIAEKIEEKIKEFGGKPAFPINLSINEIAAHYSPFPEDKTIAHGLLKVDIGVHIDGWIADTAFSVDLENSEENKKLIESSKKAVEKASRLIIEKSAKTEICQIGKAIQETIESSGYSPITNLSGHEMKKYNLHAGPNIPNFDNKNKALLKEGVYAIEPFATTGNGKIHEGNPSGIYSLIDEKTIRSQIGRDVLNLIINEYKTLPFCSRWIIKKLGKKAAIGIKQLEENKIIRQYPQLVESFGKKVSQAEDTILVEEGKVIITTK